MLGFRSLLWRMFTASVETELRDALALCRQRNAELVARCAELAMRVEALEDELSAVRRASTVRELEIPCLN